MERGYGREKGNGHVRHNLYGILWGICQWFIRLESRIIVAGKILGFLLQEGLLYVYLAVNEIRLMARLEKSNFL